MKIQTISQYRVIYILNADASQIYNQFLDFVIYRMLAH
jgi:hypothetical protein